MSSTFGSDTQGLTQGLKKKTVHYVVCLKGEDSIWKERGKKGGEHGADEMKSIGLRQGLS